MVSYQSKVVVDRPPEVVFDYCIDPAKQALWSDVPMRRLTEGPLVTGSRFEVMFGKGPLRMTLGLELTAVEPGRRMAWTTFSGPARWEGEYAVAPTASGATELRQDGRLQFTGLWRLFEPLVAGEIKADELKELERLKAVAEAA